MLSGSEILASARATNTPSPSADWQKARKTADDFEAFFLTQTLEQMFSGLETDGMFGGGDAEKIWRSFLLDEYGKQMVKAGGIGMADEVMNYMLKMQEENQPQAGGK
ncbi:MAG: rod-binding protein [Alphaproteobacteria bacterium]|nr:rod-binding protein [Alphaproteobacteria bacterium]